MDATTGVLFAAAHFDLVSHKVVREANTCFTIIDTLII